MKPPKRVLIVDDEEGVRGMLADFFDTLGYQSISARNGREALDLIEKRHVSLVISDIKMPIMDGMELLRRIKATIVLESKPPLRKAPNGTSASIWLPILSLS